MGMPLNGCSTSRSLSPLIMQEAFAEVAGSRNFLSFGSQQTVTVSDISAKIASSLKYFNANNFASAEIYLSNFGRNKTSLNSSYVLRLAETFAFLIAFSNAFLGLEYLNKKALINVLALITTRLFFIQQFFKNFFCKTVFYCFITDFIKQGHKLIFFHATAKNFHLFFNISLKLPLNFRRNILPFFSRSIIYFYYNSFHLSIIRLPPHLQNMFLG
jgi:hypothetical protein